MEGSDTPLGFVGFAFAENAGDQVKILQVDGGDGCVAPSRDTIADESYPLSRTLYIYVNKAKLASNPAAQGLRRLLPERQRASSTPSSRPATSICRRPDRVDAVDVDVRVGRPERPALVADTSGRDRAALGARSRPRPRTRRVGSTEP